MNKDKWISARLPTDVLEQVRTMAVERDVSMATIVRWAVTEWVKRNEKGKKKP